MIDINIFNTVWTCFNLALLILIVFLVVRLIKFVIKKMNNM